ncbi:MAG: CTP synthetase [Haloferacaceae archaeon]
MTTNTDAKTDGTAATDARVIVTGPDEHGLGDALETRGATVTRIPGIVNGDALEDAGIEAASILVLTDLAEASAIPVAKERNPAVQAVSYSHQSLPEYAKAQADLAVDPDLLSPDVVAEELLA